MKTTRGVSRRELAAALAATPALAAQTPPPSGTVNEAEAARAQLGNNSAQLRKTKVPTLLEPSFSFRP